jgi:hypothetical protein
MSSQTFKAQVAIGSWARAPFWPGLSAITKIVESEMKNSGEALGTQADVEEEGSENSESDF